MNIIITRIKILIYSLVLLISFSVNSYSSEIDLSNTSEMKDRRLACKTFFESLSKSKNNEVYSSMPIHILLLAFMKVLDPKDKKKKKKRKR